MIDISIFTRYKKECPTNKQYKKVYKFDYMEDWIKKWKCEHITKEMIVMMPYDIFIWADLTDSGYRKDHYGEDILDFDEWHSQRNDFIDYLYKKYKR